MARVHGPIVCCCVIGVVLLLASSAGAQTDLSAGGHDLPAPLGFGFTVYSQAQDYQLSSLQLGLPGIDPSVTENLPVDNRTDSFHLKLDYWVLPFLNLYAIGGRLETTTKVSLANIDIGLPFALSDLNIDNDGWVWGGGFTLAGGWDRWFATVSATYTEADLEVTDGTLEATVLTPKFGYTLDGGAFWVGAMYQEAEENHRGVYTIPYLGEVPFEVVLGEASQWSGLIGGTVALNERFMLILEAGFGPRQSAMISLEYRR